MTLKNRFYITTAIAYVNAAPHIGFALEFVQTDALARWHRQAGYDVFFLTGTDEHGTKNYTTAKQQGIPIRKFVTLHANEFKALAETLNISNDFFIRTSDQKVHFPGVWKMWKLLEKRGDIYKKKYSGRYCAGCERFVTEKDLVNNRCSIHHNLKLETIEEENYFFRLSKYQDRLIRLIESDRYKITPKSRKNEVLSFIREGLQDISFSRNRKNLPWGIPVPGNSEQVMYVWCDALSNYLTGIGFPSKRFEKYWPADVHVIGKDITRFHAVYWPAMLISAGLPTPKELFVHGFITSEGKKMSKSLGNVVDPFAEVKKYSTDAVRYFLLREIPSTGDGDYSQKAIISRINNELANELGNLVSRSLTLIDKFAGGKVPRGKLQLKFNPNKIQKYVDKRELHKALEEIWALVSKTNEYVARKQPWTNPKDLNDVLFTLAESLRWISALTYAFIPQTAEEIARQLGLRKVPAFAELKTPIRAGTKIRKGKILFTKVEEKPETKEVIANKVSGSDCVTKKTKMEVKPMVKFEDFNKLDLRVGRIVQVENHPNADNLYRMQVDFGAEKRQVLAGLKQYYKPAELKGRQAVFVVNLEPREIRGEKSQAMILAAEAGSKVIFISPKKNISNGARIH